MNKNENLVIELRSMLYKHSTSKNTSVNPLTALLNSLPTNISSAVFPACTPESTKRSRRPPSAQSFPIEDKKQDKPPTFKYWDMFLVAIQIMLSNVRAEREGYWSAHLMFNFS
jgi:hypothetical protein